MWFDYLLDLFGRFRKGKSRFTELENKAVSLLKSFVDGKMGSKEFATAFDCVRMNFMELTKKDGQTTIDQDTPLWMNSFLGLHFVRWHQFQQVKWHFEEHPEELVGQMKNRFEELQRMGYDEQFYKTCKILLKELKK